jgi:hypothetical protein
MLKFASIWGAGMLALGLLLAAPAGAQTVYFNTASYTQSLNTVQSLSTNGGSPTNLLTATGIDLNKVSRCTALAVDALNGKLFLLDTSTRDLWMLNLDGSGKTLVKNGLTSYPTDVALDVLNEQIYLTTSSTIQANNTVQRMDYTGSNNVTLFTALTGMRCTALAVDVPNAKIFLADAGARTIWGMDLNGGNLFNMAGPAYGVPVGVALDPVNRYVYYAVSSPVQGYNSVQRVGYGGIGQTTVFTASGGVQRCTALDLDLAHGTIYLSDTGANTLWRLPIGGGSPTTVLGGLAATAKKVRWYGGPLSRPQPYIAGINVSGTNVTINATNGYVGGAYYLLTSTNVAAPLSQWQMVSTNVLGASGNFSLVPTNALFPGASNQFFILRVQ